VRQLAVLEEKDETFSEKEVVPSFELDRHQEHHFNLPRFVFPADITYYLK
jgi:hypothetical protein